MAKKISILDIIKVVLALIPIGIKLYKQISEKKDEKEKTKFLKATVLLATCRMRTRLVPIGEARIVQKLPNGNYEVTPAFVWHFYLMKKELDKKQ